MGAPAHRGLLHQETWGDHQCKCGVPSATPHTCPSVSFWSVPQLSLGLCRRSGYPRMMEWGRSQRRPAPVRLFP
jgi:hypothetical protein